MYYPWLLLLLLIPAALGGTGWITFRVFKSPPNVLCRIGALLGWGGFWAACFGACCSFFLDGTYPIQIGSCGGFAWILGVYVTLTWAELWERKRPGAFRRQNTQTSADLSQPLPDSAPPSICRELLVVERWLQVIDEHKQDAHESHERNREDEKISCSVREASKEERNSRSTEGNVVLLMRSQSPNRLWNQASLLPGKHHRLDGCHRQRARCTRLAIS